MGRLPLSALKQGMVLADDVRDRNGRLLLEAGLVLEERHLRIFKIWGIAEVFVEADEEPPDPPEERGMTKEMLEAAEQYQRARFAHNDLQNELIAVLLAFCVDATAKRCTSDAVSPAVLVGRSISLRSGPPPEEPPASSTPFPKELLFDAEKLVREELSMGTLPMIFHKLVEVVNDPRSSALDAADIIEKDPELATRLLKIVNSSFYGMRAKVDSVSRAVAIIGGNQLLSLAVGLSVVTAFQGIPAEMVDMESFWRHSVGCGIASRLLAGHQSFSNTERFFVSGLLHDIGRLALYTEKPDVARKLLERARAAGRLLVEQELLDLGFSHCRLGGLLLETWKLPLSLESNVAFHHDHKRAQHRQEAAILHVADFLVNALEQGTSGERYVPSIDPEAIQDLTLTPGVLVQVAQQVNLQLDDVLRFFTHD